MNALVIFQETEWRELISFYLEGHFGLEVKAVASEDDAILELIRKDLQYQTVFCGPFLNADRILWCILAEGHQLELILNSDPELKRDFPFRGKNWIHFLPGFDLISSLELVMVESPAADSTLPVDAENTTWVKIKPRLLLYSTPAPGPIYLKRKLGTPSQWRAEGEEIEAEELNRMAQDPEIEGFLVQRAKSTEFALRIQETLLKRQEEVRIKLPIADLAESDLKENRLDYLKKRLQVLKKESQDLGDL